jgi:hypothetical protein
MLPRNVGSGALLKLLLVLVLLPAAAFTSRIQRSLIASQGPVSPFPWPADNRGVVFAFGDLHGDLEQAVFLANAAGLTSENGSWVGGRAILVQTGDMLDDGPDDLALATMIQRLQQEAPRHGGRIVALLGNHEVDNLRGDYSQTNPRAIQRRAEQLQPGAPIGRFLRTLPVAFIAGEFMFVHGGVTPATLRLVSRQWNLTRPSDGAESWVARLNEAVADAISSRGVISSSRSNETVAEAVLNLDPMCGVTEIRLTEALSCRTLADHVLSSSLMNPVRHLVVGHVVRTMNAGLDCPHGRWCWWQCGGSLLQLDFGISRWKGGSLGQAAFLRMHVDSGYYELVVHRRSSEGADTVTIFHPAVVPDDEDLRDPLAILKLLASSWSHPVAACAMVVASLAALCCIVQKCCMWCCKDEAEGSAIRAAAQAARCYNST